MNKTQKGLLANQGEEHRISKYKAIVLERGDFLIDSSFDYVLYQLGLTPGESAYLDTVTISVKNFVTRKPFYSA